MSDTWTRERLQEALGDCPFIAFMRLEVESLDPEAASVALRMPLRPEMERAAGSGQFHGGPVASLIDTAGDYAVALRVGGGVPTANFRVDFLRPCTGEYLVAKAVARKVGRTLALADVDVLDSEGRLCATGRGSYVSIVG